MENCVLRPAAAADYAYIAEWAPDAAQCRLFSGSADYFPYDTARLPEQLDFPGSRSFVLLYRGDAAAFGQYWTGALAGEIHLGRLLVSPGRRGLGLGEALCRLLMKQALADVPDTGAFTLRVFAENTVAAGLYRKLGFEEDRARSRGDLLFLRKQAV